MMFYYSASFSPIQVFLVSLPHRLWFTGIHLHLLCSFFQCINSSQITPFIEYFVLLFFTKVILNFSLSENLAHSSIMFTLGVTHWLFFAVVYDSKETRSKKGKWCRNYSGLYLLGFLALYSSINPFPFLWQNLVWRTLMVSCVLVS